MSVRSDSFSDLGVYDDSGSMVSLTESTAEDGADEEFAMISDLMSDEALKDITGRDDLSLVHSLETSINTEEVTIRDLGSRLPKLRELKLVNSHVPSVRDLGTSYTNLQVLWVSRASISELDGVAAFPCIRELYLSFNDITDLTPLSICETLEVLDLEGNDVEDMDNVEFLAGNESLQSLTLEGNPVAMKKGYRKHVLQQLTQLTTLDDLPSTVDDDNTDPGVAAAKRLLEEVEKGILGDEDDELFGGSIETVLHRIATPSRSPHNLGSGTSATADETLPSPSDSSLLDRSDVSTIAELDMVRMGIKAGRVGIDDASFQQFSRPASSNGRPGSSRRPQSASLARRPTTASLSRPMTARPSSAGGSSAAGGNSAGLRGSRKQDEDTASALTFGDGSVLCGNAASALRARRSESNASIGSSGPEADEGKPQGGESSQGQEKEKDTLLEELKRWKLQTATMALQDEELGPVSAGMIIGGSDNVDRLVIDDDLPSPAAAMKSPMRVSMGLPPASEPTPPMKQRQRPRAPRPVAPDPLAKMRKKAAE